MNGTPRVGGSFPTTPDIRNESRTRSKPDGVRSSLNALPNVPQAEKSSSTVGSSVIPLSLIDAPTQRLYVLAVYGLLWGWRLWDWGKLVEDEADSFWLFLKWSAIDAGFMFGVPEMKIPWLEWSTPWAAGIFLLHAILNGWMMFRLPAKPALAWLVKTFYDRELSVLENAVDPKSILQNSSLIMGKQIINILPEGHAVLNPEGRFFCVDADSPLVRIPLQLNQTTPQHIEILRFDFGTNQNETIEIKGKELKNMRKKALRTAHDDETQITLDLEIKKPGLYRLQKVIDDAKLEVQRHVSDTLVFKCPRAAIKISNAHKCVGDLSDVTIDVQGTPPMKVIYSRYINKDKSLHNFQSIQPENLVSPFIGSSGGAVVHRDVQDLAWADFSLVSVRLNESLTPSGQWKYAIEEIHDAMGNVAKFSTSIGEEGERTSPRGSRLEQAVTVHKRPQANLQRCDSQHPLNVRVGGSTRLPVDVMLGEGSSQDAGITISWKFSALDQLTPNGDHGDDYSLEQFEIKGNNRQPVIRQQGLYTLTGISSKFCDGEIKEPASCLLLSPPEPDLSISSEAISDNCAGNSIGLLVDLDLTGTPPFLVKYETRHREHTTHHEVDVPGLRHQLELKPSDAGHFTYQFVSISDDIYASRHLYGKDMTLEQSVKPPASANIKKPRHKMVGCLEQSYDVAVELQGEPPFALEYELVHNGKRKKQKIENIEGSVYEIPTGALNYGGEYTLALASVQDRKGCKIHLSDEISIQVNRQRPKASFGLINGKRHTMSIEGKDVSLPLRLEGEGPWSVTYRNLDRPADEMVYVLKEKNNDAIIVKQRGTYQIMEISDRHCPGTVESSAAKFDIDWIPRPSIRVAETARLVMQGSKFVKREVCEGDVDAVQMILEGSPPYHLQYKIDHSAPQGSASPSSKKESNIALGTAMITMDTTKAGTYTYTVSQLSDDKYLHDSRQPTLVMQQTVNARPMAVFSQPGQSYKYCKEEVAGDEVIPITLQGVPPFSLEVEIRHPTSSRSQIVKIPNIETNKFNFRIPHDVLSLGTHQVSVRRVRDSRGCDRRTDHGAPTVQVQVFDVPTVYPLESRTDYCVGDRISYTISGTAPFEIYYTFAGIQKKAKNASNNFKRIAEKPGEFTITGVSDRASECKASVEITKTIHELPSVKLSKGRQTRVDIHEGGQADILFEFWGTPPFEFTYTRSTNAKKNHKSQVLETKHDVSYEHTKVIQSSQEGTYEVVAIKDKFCAFSTQRVEAKSGQKLIKA